MRRNQSTVVAVPAVILADSPLLVGEAIRRERQAIQVHPVAIGTASLRQFPPSQGQQAACSIR